MTTVFDLIQPKKENIASKETSIPESNSELFSTYKPQKYQEPESLAQSSLRHGIRTGSRALETIASGPGELVEFGSSVGKGIRSAITGESSQEIEKKNKENIGKVYQYFENLTGLPFPEAGKSLLEKNLFPTKEKLQKLSEESTGGYTAPKTDTEKEFDKFTDTVSSFIQPGSGNYLAQLGRGVAITLAGMGAEKTAKMTGASESGQNMAKMGTMFLTSMINPNLVRSHFTTLYQNAERLLPQNATTSATNLQNTITNLRRHTQSGMRSTGSKDFLNRQIDDLENLIHNGQISVQDAVQAKKDLLENASQYIYSTPGKEARAGARRRIQELQNSINDVIDNYGRQNPRYVDSLRRADEVFGAYHQSRKVSDYISAHPNVKNLVLGSPFLMKIFNIPGAISAGAGAGVAAVGLKGAEIVHRLANSPELRRLYLQATVAAAQENTSAFIRNVNKMKKQYEDDPSIQKILEE